MFTHQHPYEPFIPKGATKLIVGTLPPPRFTTGEFKAGDVDFCYGSRDGYLWPILDRIFDLNLSFETTDKAVEERKAFLVKHKIGICDIVERAYRAKVDASDLGMQDIELRDLLGILKVHEVIDTLLFMGGNSKNGPEYFFRKHLKGTGKVLHEVSGDVPRIHNLQLGKRIIKTVSLISPSGAANRAVGSLQDYKRMKKENPEINTLDFRVVQYAKYFRG
ncbi:uracil-DNA glycosylase family protein [Zhouia amylolytica]|uniref:G:T/U mismatch-specific DNA glycosylase n=1 Tax=Zhouia amylolytica AD3 TaxID=1286632 RepID=W2URW2_9FLAO|nr:uracil-DNA glycosylase family protein [Zhouia amylolytica]ETN96900.1 hypothetical protein P278_03260 [Zhouia amylolytica AD3]